MGGKKAFIKHISRRSDGISEETLLLVTNIVKVLI